MARSVLLQLARDSIAEVFEAKRTIKKQELLREHPLLSEVMATTVKLYIDDELCGESSSMLPSFSLLEDIIRNAKIAAFENKNYKPLTTSQYLSCELELLLTTENGVISERDPSILKTTSFTF